MKYASIADLPPSASTLTLIQKGRVLKKANSLIELGHDPEAAVIAASERVLIQGAESSTSTSITKSAGLIEDERISYEIVYEPMTEDVHGNWMTEETILKGRDNFEAAKSAGAVTENLFHMVDTNLYQIESTWVQPDLNVSVVETGQVIKAGSWVAKVKYSPELWDLKKSGVVGGLSIQCSGDVNTETGEITNLNFGVELQEETD